MIRIEVLGGIVTNVYKVTHNANNSEVFEVAKEGIDYELIDYDNIQAEKEETNK